MSNVQTLVQEVYFDLCDLLDHNKLNKKIKGFYEFEDLQEFIEEQKAKLSQIEHMIDRGAL